LGLGVTVTEVLALLAAGAAAGFVSTVVGLASLISYPALLAIGLPPLTANMTNTVALLFTGVGAAAGSRPELAGQGSRIRGLWLVAALGGGAGAALLLVTPAQTFQRIAPILIGAASLLLLVQPGPGRRPEGSGPEGSGPDGSAPDGSAPDGSAPDGSGPDGSGPDGSGPDGSAPDGSAPDGSARDGNRPGPGHSRFSRSGRGSWLVVGVFLVTIYVGYFGAAGGILMLAVLTATLAEPMARSNALRNVIGAMANGVAAVCFAVFGHVDWAAVPPLAAGFLVGGWTGPALVRRLPGWLLRIVVALLGLAVAVKLALAAYG
jgi:hypothetical protein